MTTLLTLLTATALAAPPKSEVVDALAAFNTAVASGDADAASRHLHPDSVQVVQMASGPMTLGTEAYLGMIREGKVGGAPIELDIKDVRVTGTVATASAVRLTGPFALTDAVSLAKVDGSWLIVGMAVQAEAH